MVMIVAAVIIIAAVVAVRVIVALVVIVAVSGRVLCRSRRRHECHRERAYYRKTNQSLAHRFLLWFNLFAHHSR